MIYKDLYNQPDPFDDMEGQTVHLILPGGSEILANVDAVHDGFIGELNLSCVECRVMEAKYDYTYFVPYSWHLPKDCPMPEAELDMPKTKAGQQHGGV